MKDGEGGSQLGTQSAGAVSGTREVSNSVSVDGINGNPRGGGNRFDTPLNMEAVGEIKVLLNNYQAEYGQSSGGIVNLVTKSGGQNFHGEAYYFNRNEAFNANDTFNKHAVSAQNPNGIARPRNRFNTIGYNFGGPIYWPGKFNSNKQKLFFFFSQEIWPTEAPAGTKYFMMPTALEKSGDFSQSFESVDNGFLLGKPTAKVTLKDPKNCGPAQNLNCLLNPTHINPAYVNPNTLVLLNILPTGNPTPLGVAPNGALYNYVISPTVKRPVNQQVLRIDYNITDKWRLAFHGMNMSNNQSGPTATGVPSAMQWGIPFFYHTPARNAGFNLTFAATPTLVNEFSIGYADWKELTDLQNSADLAKLQRNTTGVNIGQFNPASNPLNIVPRATFGGGSNTAGSGFGLGNAPQISFDNRFPFNNNTGNWELNDGLTKVWNRHTFKVGIYGQKGRYVQHPIGNIFDGQFAFDINTKNTLDSGYAYANALLGNYNNYQEGTRTVYAPKWKLIEWYLQDNWKLTNRLTLDYGVRFSYDSPTTLKTGDGVTFVPSRYDPRLVPALYQSVSFNSLNAAGKALCNNNQGGSGRCAQNPNNPADIRPNAAIGTFVTPWSFVGSVINSDPTYPHALRNSNGVQVAPRFGLSWDPFGDGKTAIRAGAGLFYNLREDGGVVGDFATTAPIIGSSTVNFGNASTFTPNCNTLPAGCAGSGAGSPVGPLDTKIMPINHKIASTFATSFGIQRQVGFATVLDIAYVGTFGRHLEVTPNVNTVPYLSQFQPQNLDPTQTPVAYLNGTVMQQAAKSDNFFRPIPGYATVDSRQYTGTSNYSALQTSVTRRFAKDLQFGVAYTWSKTMSYSDNTGGTGTFGPIANYQSPRWWNYGLSSIDRTHNVVFHWLYKLPNPSHLWNNPVLKAVADNWEWSGISEFVSGTPQAYSYGQTTSKFTINTGALNLTGGGDGARILIFGDPLAPASQRHSTFQYLNPNAFFLPPVGVIPNPNTPGITRNVLYRGPGLQNWDMALAKNIHITERVHFQIRSEAYNIFNHVNFDAVNNSASFNATTGQLTGGFGLLTSNRGPRILQLVGKIVF